MSFLSLIATVFPTLVSPAQAGGIGVLATGGVHQEAVYFYDDNGDQFLQKQYQSNYGYGGMAILGDRDDRILGVMKFYYQADAPPSADVGVADATLAVRTETRQLGIATAGIQWGLLGDPNGFIFGAVTHFGAGVVTVDNTEFMVIEAGPAAHYTFGTMQVFAEATAQARYRKGLSYGGCGYVGVRYLFD
jgi:hypothetical protein